MLNNNNNNNNENKRYTIFNYILYLVINLYLYECAVSSIS